MDSLLKENTNFSQFENLTINMNNKNVGNKATIYFWGLALQGFFIRDFAVLKLPAQQSDKWRTTS